MPYAFGGGRSDPLSEVAYPDRFPLSIKVEWMRTCLIINPVAGQAKPGSALPRILECLDEACEQIEVRETTSRGDAERFARELQAGTWDRAVVVGGDGTINEVLNGIPVGLPLGIIPLGTANVLARELKIPINDLPAACRLLREGVPRPIDLGLCNGRRFALMAGIGFDAEVVREVPPNIKDLIGAPAYVLSAFRRLAEIPSPLTYRLILPGSKVLARGMMLVVANAASYGGPVRIAPLASLDDGYLDLCLFRERNKLAFLGQIFNVLMRRQLLDPRFSYHRAQHVRIECDPPAAVQLDGDYFGTTPVDISVLPAAIPILQPR